MINRSNTCLAAFCQRNMFFSGVLLLAVILSSCKKEHLYDGSLYSIKVFNGLNGAVSITGDYSGDRPLSFRAAGTVQSRKISPNSNFMVDTIVASYFTLPDTLAKDQPVLRKQFNIGSSQINTLFLIGDKTNTDHLLAPLEHKRYTPGDSVTYLTFVNISNDQPVSINLQGSNNGSLVSQLAYKAISNIIELPAGSANTTYNIEFRDAMTGDSLTTFLLNNSNPILGHANTYLYKNSSVVLVGKRGQAGVDKMETVRISHD